VARDPDDNPVVQTAVEGNAEVLCTLDRHFRDPVVVAYCAAKGIRIVGDVELLRELKPADRSDSDG
jgi:predicted nucleic acid-binding protein